MRWAHLSRFMPREEVGHAYFRQEEGGGLMKITGIRVWDVPLTSHETYYMADGKTCDTARIGWQIVRDRTH